MNVDKSPLEPDTINRPLAQEVVWQDVPVFMQQLVDSRELPGYKAEHEYADELLSFDNN